jgi:hypothetical protein
MSLATPVSVKDNESQRRASLKYVREQSESVRDIGPIPKVVDPKRRKACEQNFRKFCETYFAETFSLEWSEDHLKAIGKIESAILHGGLFAFAMPRGSGKTTLCEAAAKWSLLYGHRRFLVIIGSDAPSAEQILDSVKKELEGNELLGQDFPEVCFPIERLEGIAHRCKGQTCGGERTGVVWSNDEIVFPTVPGSKVGGAIIRVAGITGRIRGQKFKTKDGVSIRPDLVLIDDPQTDESANSLTQCASRERTLAGAVLGLAGPGKKIAGFMPCTVIRSGDMADNILNRDKHPEWNGERTKMLYSLPSDMKLWETYRELRADSMRAGGKGEPANEFYQSNRQAMDAGARAAWLARYEPGELSAIQNAMNILFRDEFAFYSEYQNDPRPLEMFGEAELTPEQVAAKVNRRPRREVPLECTRVTAFIDVQKPLLPWMVCGWTDDFTGYILDYGSFPDQKRPYYTVPDAKITLQQMYPKARLEGQLYAGLTQLVTMLSGIEWKREDGVVMRIDRGLIDANWGDSTNVVYQFVRECQVQGVWMPSHGKYVGASSLPFSEYRKTPGERVGLNWRIPIVRGKRAARYVLFDTNFWKSCVHAGLTTAMGDRGCLSLFGERPEQHRMISEQITAEYRVRTAGRGRELDEWKERPDRRENHGLDLLTGNAVAASERGSQLQPRHALAEAPQSSDGSPPSAFPYIPPAPPAKKRLSLKQIQQDRKARR